MKRLDFVKLLCTLSLAGPLAACGESPTATKAPATTPLLSSGNNNPTAAVSGNSTAAASGNSTTAVSSTKLAPVVGADGQITVMAPPPTGENLAGQFFWVKENNIWQGGAGTSGGQPLSIKELGGKQLTKAAPLAIAQSPAISPDGSKMAYAYSPEPEGEQGNIIIGQDIYLFDLTSGDDKLLVKRDEAQGFLDQPAWSKDGKYLYFNSRVPKRDDKKEIIGESITLNRVELATGNREKLMDDAREPAPLPDGQSVAFTSVSASTGTYETNLKVLNLQTKEVKTLLTKNLGFIGVYFPRTSPDGQWIAFAGAAGPDINPYATPNTPTPGAVSSNTALSNPGGFWLGLTGLLPMGRNQNTLNSPPAHGVPYDLWIVKPDGSGLKRLTSLFEDQPMAAWSSDSKKIAFLAGQGFYMIDSDGKNMVKRSDRGSHGGFDWKN